MPQAVHATDPSHQAKMQNALCSHALFSRLSGIEELRLFMEDHIFAVWDFMCLLKRLQRELTSCATLWLPPSNPLAARLINEIVMGEESDILQDGPISHFELYRAAMDEVQASGVAIDHFITLLRSEVPLSRALSEAGTPPHVRQFVQHTIQCVESAPIEEVLGAFFFGREDLIPQMFRSLLMHWQIPESQAPLLHCYLNRHIEVDQGEHGPAAARVIETFIGQDPVGYQKLMKGASEALQARIKLWDGTLQKIVASQQGRSDRILPAVEPTIRWTR